MMLVLASLSSLSLSQTPAPDAYLPLAREARIVPEPQEQTPLSAGYTLTPETLLYLETDTPALRRAASDLQDDIQRRYGFRPPLGVGPAGAEGIAVRITPLDLPAEGYILEITPSGVSVTGVDERGAFYGLQSLRQLLGGTPDLAGVQVRDYPDHRLRVAMIYLERDAEALNERLIPLLAAHKFNALLVVSNYLEWDSAPELHTPQSASKAQARRLAELARSYLLEPIPLLETLGHGEWLFANGQNRDLLQDPGVPTPYAYDPLNERVYEVLFPILDELVGIFAPRYLHVGHDEVRSGHPFPSSEAGLALGFGQLFVMDTLKLHGHLSERGARTMLWQDELLSAEVTPLLADLPKDLLVTSWTYLPAGRYPDLERLRGLGFETLGATWDDPVNIRSYARFANARGALGMVQTRWTGYFGGGEALFGEYPQFYAYLEAANAFWNVDAAPLTDAPERFRDHWLQSETALPKAGTLIDLSPYATQSLHEGFLGLDPGYALEPMLESKRFGGVRFDLSGAVALASSHRRAQGLPERLSLELERRAGALAFLHTSGWSAPAGQVIGRYRVHYQDGTSDEIPLVYGETLSVWTETEAASINHLQGWRGETPNGLPVALSLFFWTNPRPEMPIERLEFVSEGGLANPVLLGLTLLE